MLLWLWSCDLFSLLSTVPTFASFLKEVDSPYEVHDYVRAYLGETIQAKDFASQFLERRAKQNANQLKPLQDQQQKNQQVCLQFLWCWDRSEISGSFSFLSCKSFFIMMVKDKNNSAKKTKFMGT